MEERIVAEQPYRFSPEEIARQLQTNLEQGLSTPEAQARLARYGYNELPEEAPTPLWKRFLAQFKSFLVILLLVAAAISIGIAIFSPESGGEELSMPGPSWPSSS